MYYYCFMTVQFLFLFFFFLVVGCLVLGNNFATAEPSASNCALCSSLVCKQLVCSDVHLCMVLRFDVFLVLEKNKK